MNYKERMHPRVSNAETDLFKELSAQNLTRGMTTQDQIILRATYPDFYWKEHALAVYLDGPCHTHGNVEMRDDVIDNLLELRGVRVLRFPYKPPLKSKMLLEIVGKIREALGE